MVLFLFFGIIVLLFHVSLGHHERQKVGPNKDEVSELRFVVFFMT